jgi:lysyl-tRNA synthetase, class II
MGHSLRKRVPRFAAAVCILLGIFDILAILPRGLHGQFSSEFEVFPGIFENAVAASAASAAVLLWFIAGGLSRKQQRAWFIAMFLLALSFTFRMWALQDLHLRGLLPLSINIVLLAILLWSRDEFHALSAPISGVRLQLSMVALLSSSALAGYIVVAFRVHELSIQETLFSRISEVAKGMIGIPTRLDLEDSRSADLIYYSLLGLGLTVGLIFLYLMLRAPIQSVINAHNSRERLTQLMKSTSHTDSLGYFALRPEKGILWSNDDQACIAYTVIQGVMLASGDPIGDLNAWPGLIEKFGLYARAHSWIPAVAGCSELSLDAWQDQLNLSCFDIGDEAVVNTMTFTQHGRPMKNVRNAVARATRSGLEFHLKRVSEFTEVESQEFQLLAQKWRQGNRERGHSMALGRVCDPDDPDALIAWATLNQQNQGFLQFVPWGTKDWSLDLMRRASAAPSGIMEFLIVHSLQRALDEGVEKISLNFAPFRKLYLKGEVEESLQSSYPKLAVALLASHLSQSQSLAKFSQKFQPDWQPRYLLFPGPLSFVRVASAYLRAEAFLPRPRNWTTRLASRN